MPRCYYLLRYLVELPTVCCIEQEKSLQAYWKIYGGVTDYTHIAGLTVQILGQRMMHHRA